MVNTVLGPVSPDALGLTLMHEHPMIAWWGWQLDPAAPLIPRKEAVKVCVDRMDELKAFGMRSLAERNEFFPAHRLT